MDQFGQFIINHWGLWLAFVVILLLIFLNERMNQKKKAKALTPAGAVDAMNHEGAIIVDLRDEDTFRNGHILGAKRAAAEDFHQARMDKYKAKPIILVCARGLQSEALAAKLRVQGFEQPMTLAGGMAAWEAANLPTVKGKG